MPSLLQQEASNVLLRLKSTRLNASVAPSMRARKPHTNLKPAAEIQHYRTPHESTIFPDWTF
jgi:hypothetical protein